jgi:hypothetical protein
MSVPDSDWEPPVALTHSTAKTPIINLGQLASLLEVEPQGFLLHGCSYKSQIIRMLAGESVLGCLYKKSMPFPRKSEEMASS